jgi:hypothetical protein
MRMKAAVLSTLLLTSALLFADAGMSCIKAATSGNGNFLVVTTMEYEPGHRARQVTLDIFPREPFLNATARVVSQSKYWSYSPQWSVVLDSTNSRPWVPPCPVSLVTDDGEFLVIVHSYIVASGSALQVFRRRDHLGEPLRETGPDHGMLVKDIPLNQLWPANKLAMAGVVNDGTPQWFAGGTFEFTPDSRVLVHKTRFGTTVRIRLSDGSVSTN